MSGLLSERRFARVLRPTANWPASPRDYMNMASFYRRVAEQNAHLSELKAAPSCRRHRAERAGRLAAMFAELARAAQSEHQPPCSRTRAGVGTSGVIQCLRLAALWERRPRLSFASGQASFGSLPGIMSVFLPDFEGVRRGDD